MSAVRWAAVRLFNICRFMLHAIIHKFNEGDTVAFLIFVALFRYQYGISQLSATNVSHFQEKDIAQRHTVQHEIYSHANICSKMMAAKYMILIVGLAHCGVLAGKFNVKYVLVEEHLYLIA